MTCACDSLNPFLWWKHPRPSIFARDAVFTHGASTGKTPGQIATDAVTQHEDRTGRSLGSLYGISAKADQLVTQRQDRRFLKKRAA